MHFSLCNSWPHCGHQRQCSPPAGTGVAAPTSGSGGGLIGSTRARGITAKFLAQPMRSGKRSNPAAWSQRSDPARRNRNQSGLNQPLPRWPPTGHVCRPRLCGISRQKPRNPNRRRSFQQANPASEPCAKEWHVPEAGQNQFAIHPLSRYRADCKNRRELHNDNYDLAFVSKRDGRPRL